MLVEEELQDGIRDWIILSLCAASLLWTIAGIISITIAG
jgi:hypothetical protein